MSELRGKYFVFEGVDFSSKTTTSKAIYEYLSNLGYFVELTKHPGSTDIGLEFRKLVKNPDINMPPEVRSAMFVIDNMAFQSMIAKPAEGKEDIILADRNNVISALAYQVNDGVSVEDIRRQYGMVSDYRKIDKVIIFDITYETKVARMATRDDCPDYYEKGGEERFNKLRDAYHNMYKHDWLRDYIKTTDDELNIVIVDANDDPDSVFGKVLAAMRGV